MTTHQAELEKELFTACRAGDIYRIRKAIAAGVDPKKANNKNLFSNEKTPLHTACEYVSIGVVGSSGGSGGGGKGCKCTSLWAASNTKKY